MNNIGSEQWTNYLNTKSIKYGTMAIDLWSMCREAGVDTVPAAMPFDDGTGYQFAWDRHPHHVDIDILKDGSIEWFYLNRETKKTVIGEALNGDFKYYFSFIQIN